MQILFRLMCSGVFPALVLMAESPKAFGGGTPDCGEFAWPNVTTQTKPHAYWWWMGSAVDTNNIAKELARYQAAGLGGVHIIPIYGAKGWESNYIPYLSPKWMQMLDFTVTEAKRLGLEVDMTTGTGWCFGGPKVPDEEANAVMVSRQWTLVGDESQRAADRPGGSNTSDGTASGTHGSTLRAKLDRAKTQALMAFGPDGKKTDLLGKISADGSVNWTAPAGKWTVYAISQKPSGQKVKRAAPGGEGWMLNLASPAAMSNYLRWMDSALADYKGAKPRAQYHDSYEYKMDWSPELLAEFEKRRGYRLQDHLDAFITGEPADRAARVKCDYRVTISDLLVENTERWNQWAHKRGFITRNEAHGAPGNWLDLYAAADIPETEMFHKDRNILISKFASSAAHVTGKNLVAAETGTWLAEHFTETLADMKYLLDDLFLAGVNHVFYHGVCYSPDEAPWPGWVFYASYQMNPRNAVWHDVAALNAYAARCQAVLQAGQPDNDILLYWPIHDFWSNAEGTTRNMTVHAREWFEEQAIGTAAKELWDQGYAFDYVSNRQLESAGVTQETINSMGRDFNVGRIQLGGKKYQTVLVPECKHIPLRTFEKLLSLAESGATIMFAGSLPMDVSGMAKLRDDRKRLSLLSGKIQNSTNKLHGGLAGRPYWAVPFGNTNNQSGVIYVGGKPSNCVDQIYAPREAMVDSRLSFIRRKVSDGRYYFIANRGDKAVGGWVPLATLAQSVAVMDPMTGRTGVAAARQSAANQTEVRLNLPPGASVILRTFETKLIQGSAFPEFEPVHSATSTLAGNWQVKFLSGGPNLPASFSTEGLASWTELGDTNAATFAGTAVYSITFDAPSPRPATPDPRRYLDLGKVCQSARVRLNGKDYGTLFTPPFRVVVDNLKPTDNLLEVEVTSTSANRIRDLDRRGVKWQNFHDINFVNLNYKKFDAANWPLTNSGLLGPVTLTPVQAAQPNARFNSN